MDRVFRATREAIQDTAQYVRLHPAIADAQQSLDLASNDIRIAAGEPSASHQGSGPYRTRAGAVFLDARSYGIDLDGPTSGFRFEVAGKLGSTELSFVSGTTFGSIAAAVNSFTAQTGVSASYFPGKGIEMRRTGAPGFVSVQVIDDGGLVGDGFSIIP